MAPVRNLDKVMLWEEVTDQGVKKYAPSKGQNDPNKKYFQGNMQ